MNELLKAHLSRWLGNGRRYDGRMLDVFRPVSVELGVTKNAEGSSRVRIGDTEVMAGVKLAVESPYPDTPKDGNLMVNVELLPLSSPDFEAGPPSEEAIEIARVVDRGIREAKTLDTKKLCIQEGEKVWAVMIDICTINSDGNLLDAAALAAVAALQDTRFPEYTGTSVNYKKLTDKRLPLVRAPISVTVFKLGDFLFVDPSVEEESIFDARLTVALTRDGKICAMQKGGSASLSIDEVGRMVDLAALKASELAGYLQGSNKLK
ncbi:TPA: exosome complex protein Rrp42 [Candidatus Woesearchaeota archaeon]|nr:exosome complex protein Rrp42 [Candidatus Woesearchaeota archaeon]